MSNSNKWIIGSFVFFLGVSGLTEDTKKTRSTEAPIDKLSELVKNLKPSEYDLKNNSKITKNKQGNIQFTDVFPTVNQDGTPVIDPIFSFRKYADDKWHLYFHGTDRSEKPLWLLVGANEGKLTKQYGSIKDPSKTDGSLKADVDNIDVEKASDKKFIEQLALYILGHSSSLPPDETRAFMNNYFPEIAFDVAAPTGMVDGSATGDQASKLELHGSDSEFSGFSGRPLFEATSDAESLADYIRNPDKWTEVCEAKDHCFLVSKIPGTKLPLSDAMKKILAHKGSGAPLAVALPTNHLLGTKKDAEAFLKEFAQGKVGTTTTLHLGGKGCGGCELALANGSIPAEHYVYHDTSTYQNAFGLFPSSTNPEIRANLMPNTVPAEFEISVYKKGQLLIRQTKPMYSNKASTIEYK